MKKEVAENILTNGNLTLRQKAIVEFMRDGPRSTGQSGHWLRCAADVSRRDRYTLDQDIKLFFAVANVVFDPFISCWDTKRVHDSARPWTLVRHLYKGQAVVGYLSLGKGFGPIAAENWLPYSPANFVTPPFAGHTSGHATASGAAAKMLDLFTGAKRYEAVAIRVAGDLTESGFYAAHMQALNGVVDPKMPDNRTVRLAMPPFSGTAEMAAESRMLGGYHIATDNRVGLEVGRKIAAYSWPKYRAYFDGTAKVSE